MSSDAGRAAPALRDVAAAFDLPGRWVASSPFGSGHIHLTVAAVFDQDGRRVRYVQQRINRTVFREPAQVIENVARVTEHQRAGLLRAGAQDAARRALELVPARAGGFAFVDDAGETWRTYRFIEGASSHDVIRSPDDACVVAEAFGRFQAALSDLPPPRLHETIPRFHDARARFEKLALTARADTVGRLVGCRRELEFVRAREAMVDRLPGLATRGVLPERNVHNDTKLNNVLLDDRTGEAVCVIDLDTVMPGLAVLDFADLARTATSASAEDERDLSRVALRPELFAALAEGFLRGTAGFMTPAERNELAFASRLLTLMLGMRFLADHLAGDRYFKVHREGHNLDRCRTQLRLVESMEAQASRMDEIVSATWERLRAEA